MLTTEPQTELQQGEFYVPFNIDPAEVAEFDEIRDIESGIVAITGPVCTGRTRLLQKFVSYHKSRGKKVLNVSYNHNEIQGVDTFVFETERPLNTDGSMSLVNVNAMLARIESVSPDVVVMDEMDYAETTALAVMLVEKGLPVFVTMSGFGKVPASEYFERRLQELKAFNRDVYPNISFVSIGRNPNPYTGRYVDLETKYIAKVEAAADSQ